MKEFNQLYNYKTAFATLKVIVIVVVVASLGAVASVYYIFVDKQNASTQRIWVKTADGSMFSATEKNAISYEDRVIEYKHHVKWFYNLWYSLTKSTHEENINKALDLIDKVKGGEMLDFYIAQGVFNKLNQTGRRFESRLLEEPTISLTEKGIFGEIKGKLSFIDETGKVYRVQHLDVAFELTDVLTIQGRTDNNPHGVLIKNWTITNDEVFE